MIKTLLLTFTLIIFSSIGHGQKSIYTCSQNSLFFGYYSRINKKQSNLPNQNSKGFRIYEFKYYNVKSGQQVLNYQFLSKHIDSIAVKISPDGKTIAIRSSHHETAIINAISGQVIKNFQGIKISDIAFPTYDHSFFKYDKKRKAIIQYDTYAGKLLQIYNGATNYYGYGQIDITPDDHYIIQKKSSTKYNLWRINNQYRLKTFTANDYRVDYINQHISFIKGLKVTTYDLKTLQLIHQSDLKYAKRDYKKTKDPETTTIVYGDAIISNSGKFFVLPFSENQTHNLLLCATLRKENTAIPLNTDTEIHHIEWLNDSTIILNHVDNTCSVLHLNNIDNLEQIDFNINARKYKPNRRPEVSPTFNLYVKTNLLSIKNQFDIHVPSSQEEIKMAGQRFIGYTYDGANIITQDTKTGNFGIVPIDSVKFDIIKPLDESNSTVVEGEDLNNEEPLPPGYNPHPIKAFKHISELKDSSALINLILNNIEYTDSTISINTHLIDDDGTYYYGASSEEWKHIWCNFLLKHQSAPLQQITDFEVIEHFNGTNTEQACAIIMDHSGSMGELRAKRLQKAVANYIEQKDKTDAIALIKFDHKTGVESYLITDKSQLIENFDQDGLRRYGGATAILDGLSTGISILNQTEDYTDKSIILLTDGLENRSFISKQEIIQRAIDNNISIYIIGYGKNVNDDFLESITNATKGKYYKIYRQAEFDWIFNDINLKMNNYYEIKFKSDQLGTYKSILKVCISENQTDTIAVQFKYIPYTRTQTLVRNRDSIRTVQLKEGLEELMTIPDIQNFDRVKTTNHGLDSLMTEIMSEFEAIILPDIKFDHNDTTIIASSLQGIEDIYAFLVKYDTVSIEISGHTDSDGDDEVNMILSQNRALTVKRILVEKGISPDRIISKGFGERYPLVENTTKANKQKNRRVEFKVLL